jgi:hypothetical protein
MPAAVDSSTDPEREPDAEADANKSAVTLNYEEMLAALNSLLAEMRAERKQVDAQHGQGPTAAHPNPWVEAHAMLSEK